MSKLSGHYVKLSDLSSDSAQKRLDEHKHTLMPFRVVLHTTRSAIGAKKIALRMVSFRMQLGLFVLG